MTRRFRYSFELLSEGEAESASDLASSTAVAPKRRIRFVPAFSLILTIDQNEKSDRSKYNQQFHSVDVRRNTFVILPVHSPCILANGIDVVEENYRGSVLHASTSVSYESIGMRTSSTFVLSDVVCDRSDHPIPGSHDESPPLRREGKITDIIRSLSCNI